VGDGARGFASSAATLFVFDVSSKSWKAQDGESSERLNELIRASLDIVLERKFIGGWAFAPPNALQN